MPAFGVWKQAITDPPRNSGGAGLARRGLSALSIALLVPLIVLASQSEGVSAGGTQSPPSQITPTPDRLAKPTLPADPSQADLGAQLYWLHCMACHGDRGQGLTDEFRALYPPEDQNCWNSGCHGARPYEGGWTLPETVPRIDDPALLDKYGSAEGLFSFVRSAMPRQARGSLDHESYARIVAFLLRAMGAEAEAVMGLDGSLSPGPDSADLEAPISEIDQVRNSRESALGHSDSGTLTASGLTLVVLVILTLSILVAVLETAVSKKRN